jgi:hypothetical protein
VRFRPKAVKGAPVASFQLLEKRDDGFANGCVLLFVEHDGAGNERRFAPDPLAILSTLCSR